MPLDNVSGIDAAPRKRVYEHVMLDLETFGVGTNAAIASVGLVCFDEDGPDPAASLHLGISKSTGKIEMGTILWWVRQSEEARSKLAGMIAGGDSEFFVCMAIREFVKTFVPTSLWSNGPSFDERLLREMFARVTGAGEFPMSYNCGRDYRTIRDIGKTLGVEPVPFTHGVAHDALSDAINQASNVAAVLRHLRSLAK